VTSTLAAPATSTATPPAADRSGPTALDLLALGPLLLVALVAWASLATATLGVHSGALSLGLGAVSTAAAALLVRRRARRDRSGVLVALGCAGVAAALAFPGFSYGVADKDPGGYVSHAVAISRTGDVGLTDPVLATQGQDPGFPVQLTSPGARFPGVWVYDAPTGRIVPQFYHLWPALLATSYDLGGRTLMLATVPLPGVLSVLALVALLRRVAGALLPRGPALFACAAGGLLLATSALQVWQSRYPTTEVLAQALFLGTLLAVVVALQERSRPAAGLAGLLVGIGWLNRADGVLLVLLGAGALAALVALRRADGRLLWAAGGFAVVLPHALRQAYDLALNYSHANAVPSARTLGALIGACAVGAVLLRLTPLHRVAALVARRRVQLLVGLAVLGVMTAALALGLLRPRLLGEAYLDYNGRTIRSYDEQIVARLAWFVTLPAFFLALGGLALAALRRWSAAVWAVLLAVLPLLLLYGATARNSTRLLWWARRYVPSFLPGLLLLVALALAAVFAWRVRDRWLGAVPAVLGLGALLSVFLSQSLPLRAHDEWAGSFAVSQRIADLSGDDDGVYLWESDQGCCAGVTRLFATPVWLQHGQLSALLPRAGGQDPTTWVDAYAERFAGSALFVVADGEELPAGLDAARFERVLDLDTSLTVWEESDLERPDEAREIPVEVAVWRLRGT
jgi:hypothetical protein